MISKSLPWRKTALASLLAAAFGVYGSNAWALALGRINVQSALGDPLRAEVDILDINAEEAASLKTTIALPESFRAAGLEYNPALAGMQISLQRRADGRAFIRLSSDKAVTEPFVDLILEASWSSGRIVRDYTMLLDPPSLRTTTPVPSVAPQVSVVTVAPTPSAPASPAATPAASSARPAAAAARKAPAVVAAEPAPKPARKEGGNRVTVKPGDTASKIAGATKPAQVSLDQMLVALLRANGDAFVNGNLNRLKAGSVLTIPTEEQARSLAAPEASRTVIAQSRDFNDFRGKLASNAPSVPVTAADRKAGGTVQAQVDDKKTSAPAPDKLTLSKGALEAKAAEEKVAREKMAKDAAQRQAELSKNIKDLSSLGAASTPAAAAAPVAATAAAPLATPTPAPATVAVTAPVPVSPTSAPAVSGAAASAPLAATPPAPATKPAPKVAPVGEPGLVDQLLDNPLILLAAAALVALLAGLGIYKSRQRKKIAEVDSAFLESRLQPDSFFGASGGQRVDTHDGAATGSSMVYSPSQLDAADDVDPVAEADVYLAYGRDLQAEEILKEALRTHSGRIAVHQKLLDIYAKRRDTKAFETMANEAFKLTGGQSQDWARICEQGLTIDSTNPLYQPGGQPSATQNQTMALPARDVQNFTAASTATQKMDAQPAAAQVSAPVDLDLDLDFSLDDEPVSSIVEAKPSQLEPTIAISAVPSGPAALDMDFGLSTESLAAPLPGITAPAASVELALPDLSLATDTMALSASDQEDFRQQAEVSFGSTNPIPLQTIQTAPTPAVSDAPLPEVSFGYTTPAPLTASQAPRTPPASADTGMLEFDLGTLSLDLDPVPSSTASVAVAEPEDPLVTKLALADEFVSIGDDDGARALIEEVIAEATGDLKAKAQRALSSLG